jgi:hypothetical protein
MLWRPWAGASTLSALYNFGKSRNFSLGIDRGPARPKRLDGSATLKAPIAGKRRSAD